MGVDASHDRVLVLAAHEDDEVLGCGGTIAKLVEAGDHVRVLWFTTGIPPRAQNHELMASFRRRKDAARAIEILGCEACYHHASDTYACCTLDTIPVLELTQIIAQHITEFQPNTVFTHWTGDTHQDHRRISEAALIVTRPTLKQSVRRVLMYETAGNTDWAPTAFHPTVFVPLTQKHVDAKARALSVYSTEICMAPHPRSVDGVYNSAKYRGMQCGARFAEGFVLVRAIED